MFTLGASPPTETEHAGEDREENQGAQGARVRDCEKGAQGRQEDRRQAQHRHQGGACQEEIRRARRHIQGSCGCSPESLGRSPENRSQDLSRIQSRDCARLN
jgi:hypothetical protein